MSKGEENKLGNKIKNFLGIGGNKGSNLQVGNVHPQTREFFFTPETIKEISPQSPANNRMKTIRDLCEVVQNRKLEENAIEVLWNAIKDLLQPKVACDDRHLAFRFLQCLIRGQYEQLGIMRSHFFGVIRGHTLFEDLPHRLDLFKELTKNGKDLLYFEEETGSFLLEWMRDVTSSSKIADFLGLLVNVIKFNAAYLDEEIIAGLVLNTCLIATRSRLEEDIELCLQMLDTVICYSYLPSDSLHHFILSLCRVVNIEKFCQASWILMRKLLGTHLGHSGIYRMCCILQDKNNTTESGAILLRGAVFFIGMALWGSKKVTTLKHPPSTVLPSFHQALIHSNSSIVAYEIVLSVHRLVNKYGKEQQMVTWDILLNIVEALLRHVETMTTTNPVLVSKLHDLLTGIEELHEHGQFNGSSDSFFAIIETCASKRPETSILALVNHKALSIHPTKDGWVQSLYQLVEKYFKHEVRTQIRIKVLDILSHVLSVNRHLHEDELIELVVLPHLSHSECDSDHEVHKKAVQLLVDLALTCTSLRCLDILDLLKKVLNKPLNLSPPASPVLMTEGSDAPRLRDYKMEDVMVAVNGLTEIFQVKLPQLPSNQILKVYELLVSHLTVHYTRDDLRRWGAPIRLAIFSLLMDLRADGVYRLGLPARGKNGRVAYSPFILCTYRPEMSEHHLTTETSSPKMVRSSPSMAHKTTVLDYAQTFHCIRNCLELECDWQVLQLVLESLPKLLQNKTLVLSARQEDIDRFAARLCAMVSQKNLGLPERLQNIPPKFSKSDFHSYIFPVLTCLVSYHMTLEKGRQVDLVRCLEFGLVSKKARICVRALTVCALEMQDIMMRQLPSVLLKLSQISATVAMAIPLMEFLSSLIRLPQMYVNFVEEQYMSVFAIALPYTNPFKYSHYAVSLAYHVIAMWFLNCKLPFRKRFVGFIVKGLRSNVLQQFQETAAQRARQNQDSGDRARTNSLNNDTLKGDRRRAFSVNDGAIRKKAAAARAKLQSQASSTQGQTTLLSVDDEMMQFHKELMEMCIDALARYTFSTCTNVPKRMPVAEFLLKGGQSKSWLLGNKIITITTSGGGKVTKTGLCDVCYGLARRVAQEKAKRQENRSNCRRRHKSAAVKSLSEILPLKPSSQDDIQLYRQSSEEILDGDLLGSKSDSALPGVKESLDTNGAKENGTSHQLNTDSREEKMQMVDSVLMGLKPKPTDKSIFSPQTCNCWCTQWAEIHMRRPTGNLSWMMRIQNEQDPAEAFPDVNLSDLSSLFMSAPEESYEHMQRRKIDSMTLAESEYDTLLEEHFQTDTEDRPVSKHHLALRIRPKSGKDESSEADTVNDDTEQGAVRLRKSSSSPDLTPVQQCKVFANQVTEEVQETKSVTEAQRDQNKDDKGKRSQPTSPKSRDWHHQRKMSLDEDISPTERKSSPHRQLKRSVSTTGSPTKEQVSPHRLMSSSRKSCGLDRPSVLGAEMAIGGKKEERSRGGVSPSFLFLQLYHSHFLDSGLGRPLALPRDNAVVDRAINMLDLMYPYETHKIGVVYVGPGQASDEAAILGNVYGSWRYAEFLQGLGHLIRLQDCNPENVYMGGLDQNGEDGQFAYAWHEDFMQVIYHAATLMPNRESDPKSNAKKRHIGNDYVTIVYNDSGEDYKIGTIKCQFNYVSILISPLDYGSNAVTVKTMDHIEEIIGHTDTKIISDHCLAMLVKQMAVHANLASMILQRQKTNPKDPYASNWLERLRQIKRMRQKVMVDSSGAAAKPSTPVVEDFTDFT